MIAFTGVVLVLMAMTTMIIAALHGQWIVAAAMGTCAVSVGVQLLEL